MNQTTESAILQAAIKLFKEKGYKGTTTNVIAKEAGVTHAMLHYYYRTKEQIFLTVLDSYIKEMHEDFKVLMSPGKDAVQTLMEVTSRHFDFMEQYQGQIRILVEVAQESPEILERYREGFMRMTGKALKDHQARLDEAAARGEIAKVSITSLLSEMVMGNYATFALLPLSRVMLNLEAEAEKAFLEQRRRSLIETISNKLKI